MKNLSFFNIPIAYLLVYVVALLATGVWLFLLSQGLNTSGFLNTLMKIANTPEPKSIHNYIEVAAPHIFAMGAMVFVVAHFMLFSTKISQKTSLIVSMLLFVFLLLNIFSYGAISLGFIVSGWIKLLSMTLFGGMFVVLIFMVGISL
jgi:hypothetical protein